MVYISDGKDCRVFDDSFKKYLRRDWSLTQDLGVIRSSNIQQLDGKRCLSSEVLDGAFQFMSTKSKLHHYGTICY